MAEINKNKIVIISDTFISSNSSAAIQIRDLAESLSNKYQILLLNPSYTIKSAFRFSKLKNIEILEVKTFNIKNKSLTLRAIAEILMPFNMYFNSKKILFCNKKIKGIIWYSPSIFFGPLIFLFKLKFKCKSYLILRDIFPQWAVDLKILKKGFIYFIFKIFEKFQYMMADRIGVQTNSNIEYFLMNEEKFSYKVEVLNNWLSIRRGSNFSHSFLKDVLKNKFIFVYAGNIGVAQDLSLFLDLANNPVFKMDAALLFVGGGTELVNLKRHAELNKIHNVIFLNEIPSSQIASLIDKCHVGIISLDLMHKIDNIPGKFLQYLQCGKPVLCKVNQNNDLNTVVKKYNLGECLSSNNIACLVNSANLILSNLKKDKYFYKSRCKDYYAKNYTTSKISNQLHRFFVSF